MGMPVPDWNSVLFCLSVVFLFTLAVLPLLKKTMTEKMPETIILTSVVRDFRATHPDFENDAQTLWNRYKDLRLPEKGIVADTLGADHKPVYRGDAQTGTQTTTGKSAFDQWYRDDPTINRTVKLPLELGLDYTAEGVAQYKFESSNFFPLDEQSDTFGNLHDEVYNNGELGHLLDKNIRDRVKRLGYIEKGPGDYLNEADIKGRFDSYEAKIHNYHFTQEIVTTFVYQGSEFFEFQGDDDLWVFINDKLVIDLGGLHAPAKARIDLSLTNTKNRAVNKDSTVRLRLKEDLDIDTASDGSELVLEVGKTYDLRIFHAERHTFDSNFKVYTSIQLKPTVEAKEPKRVFKPEFKQAPDPVPDDKKPVPENPDLPVLPPNIWDVGERVVCVAPIRTIIRREEEITIIRRVRKVEEIDASPTCPVGTTPINAAQMTDIQQDS